jgi:hypothetical protein
VSLQTFGSSRVFGTTTAAPAASRRSPDQRLAPHRLAAHPRLADPLDQLRAQEGDANKTANVPSSASEAASDSAVELTATAAFTRRGAETKLVLPRLAPKHSSRCDPALIKAIARGRVV